MQMKIFSEEKFNILITEILLTGPTNLSFFYKKDLVFLIP